MTIFYYIDIIIVCVVFVKMLYDFGTKKYKKKLPAEELHQNPKIKYFQIVFYMVGIIFSGICVFTIGVSGVRDLPFVLKNQYPHMIGKIVEVYYWPHLKIGSVYKIQQ